MSENTAAEARQSTLPPCSALRNRRYRRCGGTGPVRLFVVRVRRIRLDGRRERRHSHRHGCGRPRNRLLGRRRLPSPGSAAANGTADPSMSGGPTVLGKAMDVPVGGGVVFPAAKVVVTQATAGQYKAFSAVCTHKGCTVSSVADGVIKCPCHGSTFKIADGSVVGGPAMSALPTVGVKVDGGNLVLGD